MSSYGISCLCSLGYLSCGDVTCGTITVYLTAYTTVGTANGSTPFFIIFYALKFMFSCSLFTLEPEAPLSSTLFFLLRALLGKSIANFFLFSSVIYTSSLVFLTLVDGFSGFSF
jgi:hypothetical protein